MAWVLYWSSSDGDSNVSLWASQQDAKTQCCSEIQEDILNNWDLADEDIHAIAKSIMDHIFVNNFDLAMAEWNDYQQDQDPGSYYHVNERAVGNNPVLKNMTLGPFTSVDNDDEEEDDCPDTMLSMQTSGATCRGPCKQFNEYANADRLDGTHLCTQCKTFQGMFTP